MKKLLFLLIILSCIITVNAQSWQDTVAKIEKLFSRYKPSGPGAELSISRHGELIFSKAWGMADLEHNVPLTTQFVTEAGSVSKQFTAAAILLLEQEGKLSLNDPLKKYIPEMPEYGNQITLRQMMQHTSGLKDWGAIAAIAGWPRSTKTYNNYDALEIIVRQKTLNHKPGDEYLYSNSNYNLFAIIVERLSGMSLSEYTRKKIFEPAGMRSTEWRDNFKKVVPNRVIAYSKASVTYFTDMPNEYVYGNGGLLTTTEDLVRWVNYYSNGKLGNPSLLQKQIATSKFNNGNDHNYAAGLLITKYRGKDLWTHSGATASYRANLDYFPESKLSIAFLSNTSEFDNDNTLNLTNELRNIFCAAPPPAEKKAELPAYNMTTEKLQSYEGWFVNSRTGQGVKLSVKNEKLNSSAGGAMTAMADNKFMLGTNNIEFLPGNKELNFINGSSDTTLFTRADSAMLTDKKIQKYTGEYYSEETDAKIKVILKNGKLYLKQREDEIEMKPTYHNGFETAYGPVMFEMSKKTVKMRISLGRARKVEFIKIKN
jgi:CubicO group peptidase (beta-lactamase class C family)